MTVAAELPSGKSTSRAFGYGCGITMALGAAISFAAARAGILGGLAPDDMIFARYVVAGMVMLPALIWWGLPDLAGLGWPRASSCRFAEACHSRCCKPAATLSRGWPMAP